MKRYLLLLLVTIVLPLNALAQAEFLNGYIIKNDGSISYGQVEYIARDFTVKECPFRWFDISSEYVFKPGDIQAFGFVNGMRYKSVTSGGHSLFIACLTDGNLDLLYDGRKLFLDGMGLEMVPLDNSSGSVNAEGKMVSYDGYRDLLEKLPDPDGKFNLPENITPDPEKLMEVVAQYNRSRGVGVQIFAMNNPTGLYSEMRNLGAYISSYGVIAGMNASRYDAEKVGILQRGFVPEMDFFEVTPLAGLFYNRPLSRKSDLFSLQIELLAFKTSVYLYDESTDYTGVTRSDINFSYTGIKLPVSLRVSFLKGSYKPFLSAGIFTMTNIGGSYTREGEVENALHVVRPFTDNTISIQKNINGILGGVGLKKELNPKQCLTMEVRAEYGSGLFEKEGVAQKTLSFNVIAGIDFF
jgi:hypothetical protein